MKTLTKSPPSLPCHIRPPFSDITNHSPDPFGGHLRNASYSHMESKSCRQESNEEETNNELEITMEDTENDVQDNNIELIKTQAHDEETVELCQEMLRETHGCEPYLYFS